MKQAKYSRTTFSPHQMSASLPASVLKFLEWLKKTEKRDKLYRLVAYGSKIPMSMLDEKSEAYMRLKKGSSAVGLTRKLMRMFRSLQFLQDFLQAANAKSADLVVKYLSSLKAVALMIWMLVDHVQWFEKVGYLKFEKATLQRMSNIHSKSWFFGLLFGLILNILKFKTLTAAKENDDTKLKKVKLGIAKSGLDLFIPSNRLGWLDIGEFGVGVCGTLTSLIGIHDTWP